VRRIDGGEQELGLIAHRAWFVADFLRIQNRESITSLSSADRITSQAWFQSIAN
jgi:hypothetical protein